MFRTRLRLRSGKAAIIICALTLCFVYLMTQSSPWTKSSLLPNGKRQARQKTTTTKSETELDQLLYILQSRIRKYSMKKLNLANVICNENSSVSQTCYDTSCPGQFSRSPRERLRQILSTRTTVPTSYLHALASAARRVTSHKYIFVTAASSNHYKEMQALLHNVFSVLFPRMKGEDYTFVFYDLGLTQLERNLTEKHCRCTVLDFPFSRLPKFIKNLRCYIWKPLIVASLLEKSEYLVWMDASIRWKNSTPLVEIFRRTQERGYQGTINLGSIAVRSRHSMAEFFGDKLCQYSPFSEMQTGLSFYYNDRFMRAAIMKPWMSCAFNRNCMCVNDTSKFFNCGGHAGRTYQRCHRFEQSAIGMIFSKLFLEYRSMLCLPQGTVNIRRGHVINWFNESS